MDKLIRQDRSERIPREPPRRPAFALIHDDVIDDSSRRRGQPTIHRTRAVSSPASIMRAPYSPVEWEFQNGKGHSCGPLRTWPVYTSEGVRQGNPPAVPAFTSAPALVR
ncbi:polyprenyl synthetase family protein [Kitasatospora sp. NPDC057500]|uniref:polyprenyl synthetase family protein n=1 Tax=Kitasatospora sp. NPDC057500 TaxID=3346151 RepID=UPI0036CD5F85